MNGRQQYQQQQQQQQQQQRRRRRRRRWWWWWRWWWDRDSPTPVRPDTRPHKKSIAPSLSHTHTLSLSRDPLSLFSQDSQSGSYLVAQTSCSSCVCGVTHRGANRGSLKRVPRESLKRESQERVSRESLQRESQERVSRASLQRESQERVFRESLQRESQERASSRESARAVAKGVGMAARTKTRGFCH